MSCPIIFDLRIKNKKYSLCNQQYKNFTQNTFIKLKGEYLFCESKHIKTIISKLRSFDEFNKNNSIDFYDFYNLLREEEKMVYTNEEVKL